MVSILTKIAFPNLPGLSDLAFEISRDVAPSLGIHIKWYGVFIAAGFLLAVLYGCKRCEEFGVKQDDLLDLVLVGLPAGIIGARLYYVAHMWNEIYAADPISALYIWEGGLAIYGGIIAAVIVLLIMCRIKKINLPGAADVVFLGFLIGQACGRWGNFVNGEAYGTETNLPWGMSINGRAPVHPTFFYESLWNVIGFILLHNYSKKRKFDGEITLMYMAWYGFGRMLIEGLRTDSLYIGDTNLRVSQLVAAACFLVCGGLLVYLHKTKKYPPLTQAEAPAEEEKEEN